MARINKAIVTDKIEGIKAKIASILLDELPNQATITGHKYVNFTKIWSGRRTNFNLSELPALNLSYGGVRYGDKHSLQRMTEATYYLDLYMSDKHTSTEYADELTDAHIWRSIGIIRGVLDHPVYRDLQLSPYVRHFEVVQVNPAMADTEDSAKCTVLRMELLVQTMSLNVELDQTILAGTGTQVKMDDTSLSYYYVSNFQD